MDKIRIIKFWILVLLATLLADNLYAQRSRYDSDDAPYNQEFAAGFNFNTNGGFIGGISFKYAKAISPSMYHSVFLEMVNIRHPKEQRLINPNTGSTFVIGKRNYLFTLRPMYGREFVLFKKAREQGVQVNLITTAGPLIGIEAPYLVRIRTGGATDRIVQYSPGSEPRATMYNGQEFRILGVGSITESISTADIVMGGSFKAGVSFEFGVIKTNVTGFEAGVVLDAYSRDVQILAFGPGRNFYSSVYLSFFFGFRK